MKVAVILLSTLSLAAAGNVYPGRYPGAGGGSPIVFPGQGGHIHDQKHPHGQQGGIPVGGRPGGGRPVGGGGGGGSGHVDLSNFRIPEEFFGGPGLHLSACPSIKGDKSHATFGGNLYHFSWCADGGQRYTWEQAQAYCVNSVGRGWYPVSIETPAENNFIVKIVAENISPWIWTSGNRRGNDKFAYEWVRDGRTPVNYFNWGQTGSERQPQPDNAENRNERCLALLNRFYPNDGITWHDIGCHHTKPTICEFYGGSGGSGNGRPVHPGRPGNPGNQGHVVPQYGG